MEKNGNLPQYDVPFDIRHFEKKAAHGDSLSLEHTFNEIYKTNLWNSGVSVSGNGSDLNQTAGISRQLPGLLKEYRINTLLDLPCGDFNWMNTVDLDGIQYIGGDIVGDIIERNRETFANDSHRFQVLDLTRDDLPRADLIFCRDCLVHLSYQDIRAALENIERCRITYLLTTTFTRFSPNHDIVSGDWRPLNFQEPPFNFPAPLHLIDEKCTEGGGKFADKHLALWKIDDLGK